MEGLQGRIVGVYYEMLRPATESDFEAADPAVAGALRSLPPSGYVAAGDLNERALTWACANGVMRRSRLSGRMLGLESARFWLAQLSMPKSKNVVSTKGTRRLYAAALDAFDGWLCGRKFSVPENVVVGGRTVRRNASRSFSSVEDLLRFCEVSDHGALAARRILRQYLAESADLGCSLATAMVRCSAIKSYFGAHDVPVDVKVNKTHHTAREVREDSQMSLTDFYRMVVAGRMNVMMRAVMTIKFQAGLDSSTLADRFNYEAYGQIVKHFGTEDYEAWDLDRCPIPIILVRVKTGMQYTTFIDRDAVLHLRDYLRWKELRRSRHDGSGPLFVTQMGTPITADWVSARFFKAAVNAGIQKRISRGAYRVRSHETRDLLKSTLMVAGCAPYAADHVLGHAPKDSYEKQAVLYPEAIRREYAKASRLINVFTTVEGNLGMAGIADVQSVGRSRPEAGSDRDLYEETEGQRRTQAALRSMAGAISEMLAVMILSKGKGAGTLNDTLSMIRNLKGELERGGQLGSHW